MYSIVVYLREELASEVFIWDGVVGREVVALEAEGVDPGGEVGIVVFGWYNYITEVCHFWDFSFGKGFDARGTSCILYLG